MITQQKARIEWIDCVRGLSIIFVIYHHLIDYRSEAYSSLYKDSNFEQFIMLFLMPLFFFVSGFIAYGGGGYVTLSWLKEKCLKRLLKLLVPTLVIGSVFILNTDWTTFEGFFLGPPTRYGYWFTITLFEMFIIFAAFNYLCHRFEWSKVVKMVIFVVTAIVSFMIFAVFKYSDSLRNNIVVRLIGCEQLTHYMSFFFFGVLAKMYQERFMRMIQSQLIMAVIFIAWIVLSTIEIQEETKILKVIIPFLGIVSMFSIFYYFREIFSSKTCIGRAMSYVGKNTLPIYLLHYFFIVGLIGLQDSVLHQLVQSSWVLELIIVMSFAIVIAVGCLFVEKTLQAVPIVHSILFGFDQKKKS